MVLIWIFAPLRHKNEKSDLSVVEGTTLTEEWGCRKKFIASFVDFSIDHQRQVFSLINFPCCLNFERSLKEKVAKPRKSSRKSGVFRDSKTHTYNGKNHNKLALSYKPPLGGDPTDKNFIDSLR